VDAGGDVFESLLIDLRGTAIGIGYVPIFYFIGMMEERVGTGAA